MARGDEDTSGAFPTFPRSSDINLPRKADPDTESKLHRLASAITTVVRSLPARRRWSNLPRTETAALRDLRSKPVALMPSDKGGGFCAVDLGTYKDLGNGHLGDTSTYRQVARMTARTVEGKINRAWKAVCLERGVPARQQRSFVSSSTRLATFFHLIKTHKPGPQLRIRPIVSGRGCPTEKITWLLSRILSPLLKDVPTHLPNSDSLMAAIRNAPMETLSRNQHQCSLDVEALYTSVPVSEALEAVRDKLLQHQGIAVPSPLQVEDIIKLLETVFSLAYFQFEEKVFQQTSGLPMGCAASGIVAIIFLERLERRALAQFGRCPLFLRYVDDCYALVEDADQARALQAAFNMQHPAIKYELEQCTRDPDSTRLSLLDVTVNIDRCGRASFDFYTKQARSSVFMHKDTALPWSQKTAAIRNELGRIDARSEEGNREANRIAFEMKLKANGYTARDIAQATRAARGRRRRSGNEELPVFYIDLPFMGGAEHRIRRAFRREGINIRVYRRSTTLLDMVRPRRPEIRRCIWTDCPTREQGKCYVRNCVYSITCVPCGLRYVGSTTRALHERIREHTTQGRGSTVHSHLKACGGGTANVVVKVLAKEKDEVNTRLREAIIIKKTRPELNTQEDSDLVDLIA